MRLETTRSPSGNADVRFIVRRLGVGEMSSIDAKERVAALRGPLGGYVGISVTQLAMAWWAYRSGLIAKRGLRAYFGCWELETRRRLAGGKYRPTLAELRKLVGGAETGRGGLRPHLTRLLELGLLRECSTAGIAFADSPEEIQVEDRSGLYAMLDSMRGVRRKAPVPRRMIRRLAGGLGKSRTAVVLAHFIRCLFYKKGEGVSAVGCCKASWIATTFGVTERSVYDARRYLVSELGWLIPQDNSQRVLNRNGLWVAVNLDWGPDEPETATSESTAERDKAGESGGNEFSGPRAKNDTHFSGPTENKNPLAGSNNQKPASGEPAGVQGSKNSSSKKPSLRDVAPEDLRDTGRLMKLHEEAVKQKLITSCEADQLKFVAAAEHARAVGANPCKLFAWMAWRGRFEFITQADEDAARTRLKEHFHAPPPRPMTPPPSAKPKQDPLSEDAVLVQAVTASLKQARFYGDGFPFLRREKPEWTRERWDRALAELKRPRIHRAAPEQAMTCIGSLMGAFAARP